MMRGTVSQDWETPLNELEESIAALKKSAKSEKNKTKKAEIEKAIAEQELKRDQYIETMRKRFPWRNG